MALKQGNGSILSLGPEIARGGEGTIHTIVGKPQYVAKIFHKPSDEKDQKLRAMLANPPHDDTLQMGHVSIAWPTERILDDDGKCTGFIMPYIDRQNSFPLIKIYNPRNRRELPLNFTWQYLLRMAKNLAIMLAELHKYGYVVGNLNESNVLVTGTALVTLVGCDSLQVPRPRKTGSNETPGYFLCPVGKPEYTSPELQGQDFSSVERSPDHDNFALAVLLFLLLMEGRHPFASTWDGEGISPTTTQNIQNNSFPYVRSSRLKMSKNALPLEILPPDVQKLMIQCFAQQHNTHASPMAVVRAFLKLVYLTTMFTIWIGLYHFMKFLTLRLPFLEKGGLWFSEQLAEIEIHSLQASAQRRPSAYEWAQALEKAEKELKTCPQHPLHVYSKHLKGKCPWCTRTKQRFPDPFPEG